MELSQLLKKQGWLECEEDCNGAVYYTNYLKISWYDYVDSLVKSMSCFCEVNYLLSMNP